MAAGYPAANFFGLIVGRSDSRRCYRYHRLLRGLHSGLEPESSRHASARRESPCGPRTWAGWIPAQDRNDGWKVTDASKRSSLSYPPTRLPHILPGLHPGPSIPASSLPICTF
ncbi:hypothetical protein DBL06_15245 [Agrobacterium pusense]|nr:hypothetical protein DBL06_15245 [Agrobacterium pusense]